MKQELEQEELFRPVRRPLKQRRFASDHESDHTNSYAADQRKVPKLFSLPKKEPKESFTKRISWMNKPARYDSSNYDQIRAENRRLKETLKELSAELSALVSSRVRVKRGREKNRVYSQQSEEYMDFQNLKAGQKLIGSLKFEYERHVRRKRRLESTDLYQELVGQAALTRAQIQACQAETKEMKRLIQVRKNRLSSAAASDWKSLMNQLRIAQKRKEGLQAGIRVAEINMERLQEELQGHDSKFGLIALEFADAGQKLLASQIQKKLFQSEFQVKRAIQIKLKNLKNLKEQNQRSYFKKLQEAEETRLRISHVESLSQSLESELERQADTVRGLRRQFELKQRRQPQPSVQNCPNAANFFLTDNDESANY